MLGKLIKHEWKSTYRMGCLMLVLALVVTFFGWLSFQSPVWRQMRDDSYLYSVSPLDLISIMSLFAYVFMLIGISCGIIIYLGVHFYQTMYTDRGYLTHTLPVGRHQLLCSKILVSGIWLLLISIFVYLSSMIVVGSLISVALPDGYTLTSLWREYSGDIRQFFSYMGVDLGKVLIRFVVELMVGSFLSVIILFGSITLGQLFSRARALMAIVCYVGVTIVMGMLSSIAQSLLAFSTLAPSAALDVSMLVEAAVAALLYFVAYRIINGRLNLE